MKTVKNLVLTLFALTLGFATLQAQYGYGYRNGYYGRPRTAIPSAPEPEQKNEPLTAEEIVALQMPKIMEVVDLNEFEQAVVSSILNKYVQQSIELRILELEPDKMREAMEKVRKNQRDELEAGLPADKFEALMELQEHGFKSAKKKKKKRKKPKD